MLLEIRVSQPKVYFLKALPNEQRIVMQNGKWPILLVDIQEHENNSITNVFCVNFHSVWVDNSRHYPIVA